MIRVCYRIIKVFLRKMKKDRISAFAAQSAFFILLSFIPFLMFLLTLIRFLPFSGEEILQEMKNLFPPFLHDFLSAIVTEVFGKTSQAILSASVIAALWSASRAFLVIVHGLNDVYSSPETRNYVIVRLISTLYTLVFAVLLLITLVLLCFGNQIYLYIQNKLPLLSDAAFLVISLRTVAILFILVVYFTLIYMVIPNRSVTMPGKKKAKLLEELPGALVCAGGWLLFSFLYSNYIDHMSNFSAMYGSLTAIVLCMVWLYFCMYLMFIGAEINASLKDPEVRNELLHLKKTVRERKTKG